jgi:Flp pilus assembly pilin Flp
MLRLTRTHLRSESGQAAIEYALVLPAVLIVLFVLVNFGFLFNYWNNEQQLASVAARYAVVGINPVPGKSFKEAIFEQASTPALRDNATLCVEFPEGRLPGKPVTVRVSYAYKPPLAGFDVLTLTGKSTQRLETAPDAAVIPTGPDC